MMILSRIAHAGRLSNVPTCCLIIVHILQQKIKLSTDLIKNRNHHFPMREMGERLLSTIFRLFHGVGLSYFQNNQFNTVFQEICRFYQIIGTHYNKDPVDDHS
jgi:hypothetical protein